MKTYSTEHELYIKKRKREKRIVFFLQVFLFLLLFIIWEILARFQIINTFLYSSPSQIVSSLFQTQHLMQHIGITFLEILISFSISMSLGIMIATLLWYFPFFSKVLDPVLTILNSLPKVALGPLIIIWFGANMKSIVFMSLMISLFITIINVYHGFMNVPKNYILMAKSFGANKIQIFQKIIFPSNYKNILSFLKVNISMNFIGVIMGEFLVSKKGLGYLILYGSQVFHLDLVISCIFILCIISYGLYLCINKIK